MKIEIEADDWVEVRPGTWTVQLPVALVTAHPDGYEWLAGAKRGLAPSLAEAKAAVERQAGGAS